MNLSSKFDRRTKFNELADLYDKYRPSYPTELVDYLLETLNLNKTTNVLEIGCGTGQMTKLLAPSGFNILCLDIGNNLIDIAKKNLSEFPRVSFEVDSFEEHPLPEKKFDFLISAQAFHWIDPKVKYSKSYQILKDNGALALVWNNHQREECPLRNDLDEIYKEVVPHMASKGGTAILETDKTLTEISKTNLFCNLTQKRFNWKRELDAHSYIQLLNTHSDHRSLDDDTRNMLCSKIEKVILDNGGFITINYSSDIFIAIKN